MRLMNVVLALLLTAAPALAQNKIESNIGLAQYPAPKCEAPKPVDDAMKPQPPGDDSANPRRPNAETDVVDYNRRVRAYNAAMRAHNDAVKDYAGCVQAYVAAGKADIQRIQSALDAAVAAANAQ
jgi:hypothetical protein